MVGMKNDAVEKVVMWEMDPAFKRRARIIGNAVGELIEAKPKLRIVEIGCGRGFYENLVTKAFPQATIIGVDTNQKYLDVAKKIVKSNRAKFMRTNGEDLPFKDKQFDASICSEVLEHVENDQNVIDEIFRITKPGGLGVFSVPVKNYPFAWDPVNRILERLLGVHIPANIWWLAGIWADHKRLYSEDELVRKLKLGGWKVEKIWRSTKWCMPFSHFLIYGIGKNLVERGFLKEVNRFNFENKGSEIAKFIKKITDLWDARNEKQDIQKHDSFLNLVVQVRKKR